MGAPAQAARLAYLEDVLAKLDGIDPAGLSPAQQVNLAVYRPQIEHRAAELRFRDYEITDKELPELTGVDSDTRQVAVPEMLTHRENATIEATLLDEAQLDTDHAVVRQLPLRVSGTDN